LNGQFIRVDGNIQIHAVRMPGFVASQQVILGADGQVLKIHHDTINRECYMGGVKMAIEYLAKNNQFIYGLENIL
jgi:4-hydroxy-tetrahydrodipicolinate reductase